MSRAQRLALIAAAVAILVVGFLIAQGSGNGNSSKTTTTVVVSGGNPSGGIKKLQFKKGERARFRIRSDVADEIHVHGYDLMKDVPAGGTVTFDFQAKIDGRFIVELEGRGEQIAQLEVVP